MSHLSHCWQFDAYDLPTKALSWRSQELTEPGPGQVLVKILAIGMNRSEFNYTQGRYVPARAFPSCLGQEAVGEIIAIGPKKDECHPASPRTPLKIGARVGLLPGKLDMCGMGTYRDIGLYDQSALVPIPEHYTNAEGAGFWMAVLTMAGALESAGVTPTSAKNKTVLLTAATSSMGVVACKLAKSWGATVIATTRNETKIEELKTLCDHAIVATDSESLSSGVSLVTDNRGFNAALDPVGQAFYPGLIQSAAIGAAIVSYEMLSGREPIAPIPQLMLKDLTLRGYTIYRPLRNANLLSQIIEWGLEYSNEITPIIAQTYPLSDAPNALERLSRSEHLGKIVLIP